MSLQADRKVVPSSYFDANMIIRQTAKRSGNTFELFNGFLESEKNLFFVRFGPNVNAVAEDKKKR